MKLHNIKYKSLLWGLGALAFCTTSCKDFLDADVLDQYSTASVGTYQDCMTLTKPLYGGYLWTEYESKFAWCVNEGLPGVLFNVHQEEGALFLLSIGADNPILLEGYRSLYSGVIAVSNQVIDKISGMETSASLTESQKLQAMAEARLFRGYAHFLATEYFGEAPLVMHSSKNISENIALPRVSRKTLYTAIENDLKFAEQYLPETPSENWRASKYSAKALLAKLYLTMGSCVADLPGATYPFKVSAAESQAYMNKVVELTSEVIDKMGSAALTSHADIFSAEGRNAPCSETVFALYWRLGSYGEGSAYQAQMAPESIWSPGSGWGSGKGISYTLFNSFEKTDPRLYELCFVADHEYTTVNGVRVYYGPNYSAYDPKVDHVKTGSDFLNTGQCLLNNVKKYIWGVDGTMTNPTVGMATDRRQDVIRLSDVFMMRAEAKMALENMSVTAKCSSGLDDINAVLKAHGASPVSSIAFFDDMEQQATDYKFNVKIDDGAPRAFTVHGDRPMYHNLVRADLMQQRRKEFAMEGHAWLDLKRFFYRDPVMAEKFMYQMDRGIQFAQNPEVQDESMFQIEDGYLRRDLVYGLNVELKKANPEGDYNTGEKEPTVFVSSFIERNYWYLPIPASAKAYLTSDVLDVPGQVLDQTYPY